MTDAEITPKIGELMGWEIFPLGREGYEKCTAPKLVQNVIGKWNYFSYDGDEGRPFDPLTSISDAFMVVDRLLELDKYFRLELQPSGKATAYAWRNGKITTVRDGNRCRAICLACIAAVAERSTPEEKR
jgi:hypothetical protein